MGPPGFPRSAAADLTMNGELFPAKAVRQLSPRLKWCQAYGVITDRQPKSPPSEQWRACSIHARIDRVGMGWTEEEACRDFGVKNKLALWNEVEP